MNKQPQLIMTTKGLMAETLLRRVDTEAENENEIVRATEYYIGTELVHRSAHVHLKKSLEAALTEQGAFNG